MMIHYVPLLAGVLPFFVLAKHLKPDTEQWRRGILPVMSRWLNHHGRIHDLGSLDYFAKSIMNDEKSKLSLLTGEIFQFSPVAE